MNISGKNFVVIGGAGLIGSHTIDKLLLEDVKEVIVYDNFVRGKHENLKEAVKDPRLKIYEIGGDITNTDILDSALIKADGVFHFAALWLLQCHEYPRSAFDVNIRGTYNVIESCVKNKVKKLYFPLLHLFMVMQNMNLLMKNILMIVKIFMVQQKYVVKLCSNLSITDII